MGSNYSVENILTDRDVQDLCKEFLSLPEKKWHQDYNLFDVDKRHPTWDKDSVRLPAYDKLEKRAGLKLFSHYYLLYELDSFTRMHTDDDERVGLTMVTLLDRPEGTVGGVPIVQLKYTKRERPSNKDARRSKDKEKNGLPPVGEPIIIRAVDMKPGQTLIYDHKMRHGVSQVEKGKRLVLISWFYEPGKENVPE